MVPVNVLIADDQQLVRAGFRMVIDSQPDLVVVAEAGDGEEALRLLAQWGAGRTEGGEGLRHAGQLRSPAYIRAGLNRELDKVTVWPDDEASATRAA